MSYYCKQVVTRASESTFIFKIIFINLHFSPERYRLCFMNVLKKKKKKMYEVGELTAMCSIKMKNSGRVF